MRKIKVLTDSTADLSNDLLIKYDIDVIPLYVTIGGKSYKDMVDITPNELYNLVEKFGELPKTSAPTINDYIEAFKMYIDDGYDVLYVGLSSKLSAAFQNANIASREFEEGRVFLIDSKNLSTGIGHLAIIAAELCQKGLNASEIFDIVIKKVQSVKSSFIISTLKYLHMGGRCSSVQMIAGSLLKINPQIIVDDGAMVVGSKYRGKDIKVWDEYFEDVLKKAGKINLKRIFVTHSAYEKAAEYLKQKLEERLYPQEVIITHAGCVISTHCGPGTVGILYVEDE